MAFIIKGGAGSSAANPVLDLYTYVQGILTNANAVRIKVFDITNDLKRTAFFSGDEDSVQVFPSTPGTFFNLDVSHLHSDMTTPGHKLSTGHYFAPFTPGNAAATGTYLIRWQYQQVANGPYRTYSEEFTVLLDSNLNAGTSLIEKLQMFLMDFSSKNDLLCNEVEYTQQQYLTALEFAVDKFNAITVTTCFTLANFPCDSRYLLYIGAAGMLLRSTSYEQLRNQLTYTDGNVHVGITDKHRDYQNAAQQLLAEFEAMARAKKNQMNNDSAWGDSLSPYSSIGMAAFYGGTYGIWGDG